MVSPKIVFLNWETGLNDSRGAENEVGDWKSQANWCGTFTIR